MSFVSWQYALFLPGVALAYWQLPHAGRMLLLLVTSYFFYGTWDLRFLALLSASTGIDYYCACSMTGVRRPGGAVLLTTLLPAIWLGCCRLVNEATSLPVPWVSGSSLAVAAAFPLLFTLAHEWIWRWEEQARRRAFLWLSVLTNLLVLGFFKYFGFFAESLVALLEWMGIQPGWTLPQIILPVAVSFYTFQSVAYAVQVFRRKVEHPADGVTFAAYLAFFPQLVAGPIERPVSFMPQFLTPMRWQNEYLREGLRLLLLGLFKKAFVADNCALVANHAFGSQGPTDAAWAVLGVVAFAFQIYGDFSGYTDLARGSARLLGFELSRNFRMPYGARDPSDFWQRWHITLSTWFRDYVYIPLGGNRAGSARTVLNLWITMLLAGLWHGASWTFVLWGAYHAGLLTLYRVVPPLARLGSSSSVLAVVVMFPLTLIGWVIFRCHSMVQLGQWFAALSVTPSADAFAKPLLWLVLHILPLLLLQALTRRDQDEAALGHLPWAVRGVIYFLLFALSASSLVAEQEFIYFQF